MPVPKFEEILLPLLSFGKDGEEHSVKDASQYVADHFQLSEDERAQLLPSGGQTVIFNRVGWARTFLKKAEFVTYPRRGTMKVTERGMQFLSKNPQSLTVHDLRVFPEFEKNWHPNDEVVTTEEKSENQSLTPEERMGSAFIELQQELTSNLIDQIKEMSPAFFERLVVDVLLRIGYGGSLKDAGKAIGKSGDGGIDGIIKEDKLGLDTIYIQAKRWDGVVGRPEIQKFMGALAGNRAKKGVFITTSSFTNEAYQYALGLDVKLILINGLQLAELMIENGVGVSDQATFRIMKVDADYFIEE